MCGLFLSRMPDQVQITVRGGRGGDGAISFHSEPRNVRGGPDGGDGGRGGDVLVRASVHVRELPAAWLGRTFSARSGEPGRGGRKHGADAPPLLLEVPVGTLVWDAASGTLLADLAEHGAEYVAARGGRGGRGNVHFATPTRDTPREAEPGRPGEERSLRLEVAIPADVVLVGPPNAGRSSILRALTGAHPEVGDYPFTTRRPVPGVLQLPDYRRLTLLELPGLLPGASRGAGLGADFLRHLRRARCLVLVADASCGEGAVGPAQAALGEVHALCPTAASLPFILVAAKADAPAAAEALPALERAFGREPLAVSAQTGLGLEELVERLGSI